MLTNDQREAAALDMDGATIDACPFCDAETSRLYGLPESAFRPHQTIRAACYFCFLRLTGLRPKRRQLLS